MSVKGSEEERTTLAVGFTILPPYCVPTYDSYGTVINLLGNHGKMINAILQYYNWSAIFIKSDEEGFGSQSIDGSWSSVMGLLARNRVDISHPMHMSFDRSSAIPFSIPLLYEEVTFATRAPGYLSKVFVFVKPLSLQVWLASLTTVFVFGVIMSIFNIALRLKTKHLKQGYVYRILNNIITPGSYSEKMWTEPKNSLRLAIISWSIFFLLISLTYSGIMTSFMTAPLVEAPIDSLETLVTLVNEKGYHAGSLPGLAMNQVIVAAAKTKNLSIKYPNQTRSSSRSRKDAVLRMLNERYAFVWLRFWFTDIFLEMGENVLNKFHISSENQVSMLLSMGISPESNLKDKIDAVVLLEHESGMIQKWSADILIQSRIEGMQSREITEEINSEESAFTPLTLYQCSGAFFILGVGYCLSILVLAHEMLNWGKTVPRSRLVTYNLKRKR